MERCVSFQSRYIAGDKLEDKDAAVGPEGTVTLRPSSSTNGVGLVMLSEWC